MSAAPAEIPLYDAAMRYISHGLSVFPLTVHIDEHGKKNSA